MARIAQISSTAAAAHSSVRVLGSGGLPSTRRGAPVAGGAKGGETAEVADEARLPSGGGATAPPVVAAVPIAAVRAPAPAARPAPATPITAVAPPPTGNTVVAP